MSAGCNSPNKGGLRAALVDFALQIRCHSAPKQPKYDFKLKDFLVASAKAPRLLRRLFG